MQPIPETDIMGKINCFQILCNPTGDFGLSTNIILRTYTRTNYSDGIFIYQMSNSRNYLDCSSHLTFILQYLKPISKQIDVCSHQFSSDNIVLSERMNEKGIHTPNKRKQFPTVFPLTLTRGLWPEWERKARI